MKGTVMYKGALCCYEQSRWLQEVNMHSHLEAHFGLNYDPKHHQN